MLSALGKTGLVVLVCISCGGNIRSVERGDVERAQAALKPFKKQLMGALSSAMGDGPQEAIRVCRAEAARIARDVAPPGVEIGRTSHRLRNPSNAPENWMKPLLASYASGSAGPESRAVLLDESRFGYVEPIYVKNVCLKCHGDVLDPSVKETINTLYPGDEATGFEVNDFRGLFWVTMPVEESN